MTRYNHFNLDPAVTAVHLPPGNERNEYALMLWAPPGTLTPDLDEKAWEFVDLDPVPETDRKGIDTTGFTPKSGYVPLACLSGAFRETGAGGVHRFTLVHNVGSDPKLATKISCTLLVQSLQNITINISDLPPIVRTKPYRAQVTADGGRKPYQWTLNQESDLPEALKFNEVKEGENNYGVLAGKLEDDSGRTFVLSVSAVSGSGPEQQKAERAFNLQVVEPSQIGAHITGWVDVAVGLMGLYGVANFIYEIYRDHKGKRVDLAGDLDKFLREDRRWLGIRGPFDSARAFADNIFEKVSDQVGEGYGEIIDHMVKDLREADKNYKENAKTRVARRKVYQDLIDGGTGTSKQRREYQARIDAIDREPSDHRKIKDTLHEFINRRVENTLRRNSDHRVSAK